MKNKNDIDVMESLDIRMKNIRKFMTLISNDKVEYDIVELNDVFGPTITDKNIDGLVISSETLKGGELINEKRKENNFSELKLFIIDLINVNISNGKLSSTEIRKALKQL